MNSKGQISIEILFGLFFIILFGYVFFVMVNPIMNDLLFPLLGNFGMGTITRTLFNLIPVVVAALILLYPIMQSRNQQFGSSP